MTCAKHKHYPPRMLEHLLEEGTYVPPTTWDHLSPPPKHIVRVSTAELLDAQYETAKFLEGLSPAVTKDPLVEETAGAVFAALADPQTPEAYKIDSAKLLKTPDAVKHLIAMLTAYEWEFVEEATRIRGYLVAQLLEETKNPNARVRLRAIEMLGKITEVALFTERVEIKTSDVSDEELQQRLRAKLARALTVDAETVESTAAPTATTA